MDSKRSSTTSCNSVGHQGATISLVVTGPTTLVRSSIHCDSPTTPVDRPLSVDQNHVTLTVPEVTSHVRRNTSAHPSSDSLDGALSDSEIIRKSSKGKSRTVGPSVGRRLATRMASRENKRGSADSIDTDSLAGSVTPSLKTLRLNDNSDTVSIASTMSVSKKLRIGSRRPTRRISCKDLGMGQCQGWLFKRKESKGLVTNKWSTRWCVLHKNSLYYYKNADWGTAEGVIYLPGFKVSPATEIKNKKFAFKAHHPGMTFYFAAERQDDMAKWMNKLGLATLGDPEVDKKVVGLLKPELRAVKSASHLDVRRAADETDQSTIPDYSESDDSLNASKEDLTDLYRNIRRADLDLAGSNVKDKRSTVFMTEAQRSESLVGNSPHEKMTRRLLSLNRTLKDKEQRLAAIEQFIERCSIVTTDSLREFIEQHPHILAASGHTSLRQCSSPGGDSDTTLESNDGIDIVATDRSKASCDDLPAVNAHLY